MADDTKQPFPTKAELIKLIEDRKNDSSRLEHKYDPPWMHNADDEVRMRERRIRRMATRLDEATKKMELEFDRNS